jgi:hypothetical protein
MREDRVLLTPRLYEALEVSDKSRAKHMRASLVATGNFRAVNLVHTHISMALRGLRP